MADQTEIAKLIIKLIAQTGDMKKDFDKAQGNIKSFVSITKKLFAGIGIVLVTKRLTSMVLETTRLADEMVKTSKRIGITIETVSSLAYSARLAGVQFRQLVSGIRLFASNLFDASKGMGEAYIAFREIGLEAEDLVKPDGSLRSIAEMIDVVADEFSRMTDETKRTALANDFFGRSGAVLIPMLRDGAAALKEQRAELEAFGAVIDEKTGKAIERFRDNITRLKAISFGLRLSLIRELLPGLESIINALITLGVEGSDTGKILVKDFGIALRGIALGATGTAWSIYVLTKALIALKLATSPLVVFNLKNTKKAIDELEAAFNSFDPIFKTLLGDFEELDKKAKKTGKGILETGPILDTVRTAMNTLAQKTAEFNRQYVAITNPANAARMALQAFIDQTIKGIKPTDDMKEKIKALWEEYNKYTSAQNRANEAQARQVELLAKNSRELTANMDAAKAKYTKGIITAEEYYTRQKQLITDASNVEKDAIISAIDATENQAKQLVLLTALRDKDAETILKINQLERESVDVKKELALKELQFKSQVAGQIGSLASQMYETSGRQMEAFFYIQQAAALAQAYMNIAVSATNAMKILGPGGVSLMWGIGMAQIGIILAQTLQGPKKMAFGGLITEGSGTKDDVPIIAKRNEYMMPSEATKYYGVPFMNAIKDMVMPKNFLGPKLALSGNARGNNYSINVPVSVDSTRLGNQLQRGIEKTVINIMREYSR